MLRQKYHTLILILLVTFFVSTLSYQIEVPDEGLGFQNNFQTGGVSQFRGLNLYRWLQGQDVQRALNLVRNRYTQKFNRNLGKPVYGKSQVVAGLLITFGFQTEEGVAEFSVLSQPWMNRLQVTSFRVNGQEVSLIDNSKLEQINLQQQNQSEIRLGGVTQFRGIQLYQWLQGQDVQRALALVKRTYKVLYKKTLRRPLYGRSQVVAGSLITFGFQTREGIAEFQVLSQPWINVLKIQSFKVNGQEVQINLKRRRRAESSRFSY